MPADVIADTLHTCDLRGDDFQEFFELEVKYHKDDIEYQKNNIDEGDTHLPIQP